MSKFILYDETFGWYEGHSKKYADMIMFTAGKQFAIRYDLETATRIRDGLKPGGYSLEIQEVSE